MKLASLTWARRALPALITLATACSAAIDSDEGQPDQTLASEASDTTEEAVTSDRCAVEDGISWNGRSRFMYGVNYAWKEFAADFGGVARWGVKGIAATASEHAAKLADMRAHGVSTVRWWMFPEFRGEGVQFDGAGNPKGLGGTVLADLDKALELAEQKDVYLMLCLFSFDNFRPTHDSSGLRIRGMSPLLRDANKRRQLIENVVRPIARAAQSSRFKHRLVSWDVINEPEWAIRGANPYGDEAYDSMAELDAVSHAEMERFIGDTVKVLHDETDALVTVGGAAAKWARAWTRVNLDFYQLHIYDWVNQYWPYHLSPEDLGLGDKPVVMGEFPIGSLSGVSYQQLLDGLYANGYAGALGWQYSEASGAQLDQVNAFRNKHTCETHFSGGVTTGGGTSGGACSDTPPDSRYTCQQQADWGKCGEPFLQGFCNKTCGRCSASTCGDTPPDSRYTCQQQASWGKCGEAFMQGFCSKSCGRCK
jgi:hypothetical protein